MIREDKDLLLKDLCARLPYGVMVSVQGGEFDSYKYPYQLTAVSKFGLDSFCKVYHPIYTPFGGVPNVEDIKPYLRPMSSMTEEERVEFSKLLDKRYCEEDWEGHISTSYCIEIDNVYTDDEGGIKYPSAFRMNAIDWLNAHYFDYRGLIEKGLAIEVTEENNPYKE